MFTWTPKEKRPLGIIRPYSPKSSVGKEPACNAGDLGSIPGLGRSPGEGKGYPLQYSGLENSMDCMVHRVTKSWTQQSDFHFTSKGMIVLEQERMGDLTESHPFISLMGKLSPSEGKWLTPKSHSLCRADLKIEPMFPDPSRHFSLTSSGQASIGWGGR